MALLHSGTDFEYDLREWRGGPAREDRAVAASVRRAASALRDDAAAGSDDRADETVTWCVTTAVRKIAVRARTAVTIVPRRAREPSMAA